MATQLKKPSKSAKKDSPKGSKPAKTPKVAAKKSKPAAKNAKSKSGSDGWHGRRPGSGNYVPGKPLEVRDRMDYPMHPEADTKAGLKWARIYAGDVEHSNLLAALVKMIDKKDPDLLKLMKKKAK